MDTTRIKAYLRASRQLTENEIQQQVLTLKEINKNHPAKRDEEMDDAKLREIILSSSKDMNHIFLLGQDNGIIGIGFAQFVLEGRMDPDFRVLVITAISRQLLPLFLDAYDEGFRKTRREQLAKMLMVAKQAPG